jgi:hypothetical protein
MTSYAISYFEPIGYFKREPTDHELVAWGQGRTTSQSISSAVSSPVADCSFVDPPVYDVESVEAAKILMEIYHSSRSAYSPPSQYPSSSSTSPFFSSESPTSFSSSAPKATISLEAVSSRPSNSRVGLGLFVEVDSTSAYDYSSDLGLSASSSSPTLTMFEVSTPASISSFPVEILVVPAPKKLVKGSAAYELR